MNCKNYVHFWNLFYLTDDGDEVGPKCLHGFYRCPDGSCEATLFDCKHAVKDVVVWRANSQATSLWFFPTYKYEKLSKYFGYIFLHVKHSFLSVKWLILKFF